MAQTLKTLLFRGAMLLAGVAILPNPFRWW
jgi:hypothetical protein